MEALREEIKQLIKAINVMNQILLSSQLGENLRNTPIDRADKVRGLDIVIVISSKSKDHSYALLEKLNFPFLKKEITNNG